MSCARNDGFDSLQCQRRTCIDAPNAAMCHRAAKDLAVEHSRQPQVVNIFGAAVHFGAAFQSQHRTSDLPFRGRFALGLNWRVDGSPHGGVYFQSFFLTSSPFYARLPARVVKCLLQSAANVHTYHFALVRSASANVG